jgi:two-component system, LytTR family, response regulator
VRVVIADDEPLGRLALRQLAAPHRDLDIAGEARDGREAIELVHRLAPDLLLLDVQMPELDGFDVLAALAPAIPATIFVTAHDSFAVKAFEAHALDYVVKPVGQARFDAAVARVRDAIAKDRAAELGRRLDVLLAERAVERVVARLGDRSTVIAVADIDWIEAQDYCAAVHVGNTTHVVRQTLAVLESRLDARRFVRIHRSALVNVTRIRELLHDAGELVAVLASGERLPVSRRRRDALERALGIAG